MSDSNQDHPGPEATQASIPSESLESFTSFVQGDQQAQAPSLEATIDPRSTRSILGSDLQVLDPELPRTSDSEATGEIQASGNSQSAGDLQATGPSTQDLQVPASVLQTSVAVGLQISASFGGLRSVPDTPELWAAYLRDLPGELPRLNYLLAGFRTTFHPSASMSDYLVRVIAGETRGGPVAGAGMHLMALYGLRQLNDLEILDRIIHLDLSARFYRRSWVAMRNSREREAAAVQAKVLDLEAEKESYERLKDMYEGEIDRFERDRSRFQDELDLFAGAKADFQHDVARLGHALGLGATIEQMQMDHDLVLQRLRAVLESSLIENTAQLQMLASIGLSGGMEQWLGRFQELLRHNNEHAVSIQLSLTSGAQSVNQSPLANQVRSVTQRLAVSEVQLVEQQLSHTAAIHELEAVNERLRKEVEKLTQDLNEHQIRKAAKGSTWAGSGCLIM